MIQSAVRFVKRFAVLLPGLVIAYISVRNIYPFLSNRVPTAFAVLVTYILGAYVLVPAIIRSFRILKPAQHLPLYCVTPDGFASDPINIRIISTRRELIQAMERAGWSVADAHSIRNIVRQLLSIIYEWSYPTAPVSSLFLFGRKQDIAFEMEVDGTARLRHHVRFWATTYDEKQPLNVRSINLHHRKARVYGDNLLWVGAASLDTGIGFIRHNLQFTHMIDPDTNQERELIVSQLKVQKLITKVNSIKLGDAYRLMNRVLSGSLHTDGRMAIVRLKSRRKA